MHFKLDMQNDHRRWYWTTRILCTNKLINQLISPRFTKRVKMTENTQAFNELPKPVFANDTGVTKDDMFLKSFKEAVEGGLSIADDDINKR